MATTVCKISDVPEGEARTFTVDGKEIAVFNVEGTFYATDNGCLHRGGPLGEGKLDGKTIECPWHGWKFDVTDGTCAFSPNANLTCFTVSVEGENVNIEL